MAKLIYTLENGLLVHNVKNILQTEGIQAEVRNEGLRGVMGDVAPQDCWPHYGCWT